MCVDALKPIHPMNSTKIVRTTNSNKPVPFNSSKPVCPVKSSKFVSPIDVCLLILINLCALMMFKNVYICEFY